MRLASLALSLTLPLGLLAQPGTAQTTGFPGINDLTVNGTLSGSTSCTTVLAVGLPLTFAVSAAPGSPLVVFIDTCPCSAGFFAFPNQLCYGLVMRQSLDLKIGPGCVLVSFPGTTNAAGNFSVTFPACPNPFQFSTQAAVLDPTCPPFLLTQAYDVFC